MEQWEMQSPTWTQGESMDHHGAIHAHRNVEKKGRVRVRSCHLNNSAGPSGIFLGRSWFVCAVRRLLAAIDITPAPSHSPIEPSLNPGRLPPPPFTRTRTTTKPTLLAQCSSSEVLHYLRPDGCVHVYGHLGSREQARPCSVHDSCGGI